MKLAIGMDLHKRSAVCFAVYAGDGEPSDSVTEYIDDFNHRFRVNGSEPDDMAEIAGYLKGQDAWILIENSPKTYEVYWILTNLGCNVIVAQAQDLYRITKSVKKTDKNDSEELAAYMRRRLHGENEFAICTMPPREWMFRRELCRAVFHEKLHLSDLKKRTRMHLLMHGIKLSRDYSDIFSKKAMEEMMALMDPILRIYCAEARSIKSRTDEEAKMIMHVMSGCRMYELLLSIPGLGSVSAAYLASMIMDIDRFSNSSAFAAYFDVVPKMRESADKSRNCATTHRGDEDARRLLTQAAFVHVNTVEDSFVRNTYERLRSRGKAHKEALVACARKMLLLIWSVLKNDRPFTEDIELLKRSADDSDRLLENGMEE